MFPVLAQVTVEEAPLLEVQLGSVRGAETGIRIGIEIVIGRRSERADMLGMTRNLDTGVARAVGVGEEIGVGTGTAPRQEAVAAARMFDVRGTREEREVEAVIGIGIGDGTGVGIGIEIETAIVRGREVEAGKAGEILGGSSYDCLTMCKIIRLAHLIHATRPFDESHHWRFPKLPEGQKPTEPSCRDKERTVLSEVFVYNMLLSLLNFPPVLFAVIQRFVATGFYRPSFFLLPIPSAGDERCALLGDGVLICGVEGRGVN